MTYLISFTTLAFLTNAIVSVFTFTLEGSHESYAKYPKWRASLNDTLEFEFKTDQPNGILFYTDDGGKYDFFELKLVEGALRLRYNLGDGAQILTVGRGFDDNDWHSLRIRRDVAVTSLSLDYITDSRTSAGPDFTFGRYEKNSYVYIGGVPNWYMTKLRELALPSVVFEPRFGGSVRNVRYKSGDGVFKRQEMLEQKVSTKSKYGGQI